MNAGRSLLVGAAGQVGAQMLRHLGPDAALPTSRTPPDSGWLSLDLATVSSRDAAALLENHPLNAIYCIAGMTDVEACESRGDLAHATNARGPAVLACYARGLGIPFVYFSTEYIFDGRSGPYREEDETNPINVYGQSKLAGERAVLEAHPQALILRTTVVYGPDDRHKNYVYSLMSSMAAGRTMRVPEDQVSTPTYNRDLVRAAVHLVSSGACGVFHVCGPELLTRTTFANRVADILGLDAIQLQNVRTSQLGQRAARPLAAGLDIGKLRRQYPNLVMRGLEESLSECRVELRTFLEPRGVRDILPG